MWSCGRRHLTGAWVAAAQRGVAPDGAHFGSGLPSTHLVPVDPTSGNATNFSDAADGTSHLFIQLSSTCAAVPDVPERPTLVLAASGPVVLLNWWQKRVIDSGR